MMQMVVAGTGVRIPSDKPLYLSLTSLEGVGRRAAVGICVELELDPQMQADKMSAEERVKLCRRLSEAVEPKACFA